MIFERIKNEFGKAPLCNGRPERAPHFGTFVFPLCWRCTGLFVGCIIATIIKLSVEIESNILIAFISSLPMLVDWSLQRVEIKESTNFRRFTTGLICATGLLFLS
jgi:uncharacterized membrane protein